MRQFDSEEEVIAADTPCRQAMLDQIALAHKTVPDVAFDAIADCGGGFCLMEEGDDLTAVKLYPYGADIDLTDLQATEWEFVSRSADGSAFVLYLVICDAGGPCFFLPNQPWIGERILEALTKVSTGVADKQG